MSDDVHSPPTRRGTPALASIALILAILLSLMAWSPSYAATINVTTTADEIIVNGNCSLREAILTFNSNTAVDACPNDANDDTIILPAGTYILSVAPRQLEITRAANLSIEGAGPGQTIIDADSLSRAFRIATNANVTISGVTIRDGFVNGGGQGGGIEVSGAALTLRNSVIETSTATFGGGVFVGSGGSLTLDRSTISGNTALTRGGGVFTNASATTIINSTVYSNTVTGAEPSGPFDGGGIRSFGGTLNLRNTTISGNSAPNGDGGGIANSTATVTTVQLSNTIIAGNSDGGSNAPDCTGALTSQGYNLIGIVTTACTGAAGTGDLRGMAATPIDPLLGPLQNNGGPTPTRAPLAGSPALNAGNPAAPGAAPACATIDQRSIARPQGARCDIGAFERAAAPTISALTPDEALVGGSTFELTVIGAGFVDGRSFVRWNGAERLTTFVSPTELRAEILASDLATAGTALVRVNTDLPDAGLSDAFPFDVNTPTPVLTSLNPASVTAGAGDTTVTISGTGFLASSTVTVGVNGLPATFVSSTTLQVTIPAAQLIAGGVRTVRVTNAGIESNLLDFTVTNPAPTIGGLSPASATAGAGNTTVTITGTGFVSGTLARWNGSPRATAVLSATALQAILSAADLATAGSGAITVFNPTPGGGESNALSFAVNNPAPTLGGLSPASALVGAAGTTITITGTGFVSGTLARWDGADRATTVVSATELQVILPATDFVASGTFSVTVTNPAPGGGSSNPLAFTVTNPAPALSSLSPASAVVGAGDTTVTITGTGFVAGSVVRWEGADRPTVVDSATQLRFTIPAADLAASGTFSVTVFSPTPGGGSSNAIDFTVNNPAPALTSVSPLRVPQGSPGITLTLVGSGFNGASVVRWNGAVRATGFISTTELTATIGAADLATVGEATVTVFNPAPGGGTTTAISVTIFGPPVIADQPQGQSIAAGTAATLTVTATGEAPLSYQWYVGTSPDTGNPIAGAIGATLTVTPTASTSYWVRVSNAAGDADSDPATITLIGAPVIEEQPQSQSIFLGQTATLTVTATGEGLTYQWYAGSSGDTSAPVVGATADSFTTPALTETARYWVRVTNGVGTSADSLAAEITVNGPPTIAQQPASATITAGQTVTLTVTATGEGLSYQWYRGTSPSTASPIAGADEASLAVSPSITSSYWVRVTNPAGSADSDTATVTVNQPNNPVPTLTAISPARVQAGGQAFVLVITGNNFVPGATGRLNGQNRQTVRVSSTRLEMSVSTADIASAGSALVTVFNPGPGGGVSTPLTLTIEGAGDYTVFLPLVQR